MTKFEEPLLKRVRESNTLFTALLTAAYTVDREDEFILASTSGGGFTVTLPTAISSLDREYTVKLVSGSNNLTISTPGAETIDGGATHTLDFGGDSVVLVSDGSNYFIKAERNTSAPPG